MQTDWKVSKDSAVRRDLKGAKKERVSENLNLESRREAKLYDRALTFLKDTTTQ